MSNQALEPEWLNTRAVAALTSITERALEMMRARGEGPPYSRIGRRLVRYKRADVQKWLEAGRVEAKP
jgi:predicted DNA-binding transcriptional regulator AlpA